MTDSPPIQLLPGMSFDFPVFHRLLPLLPNAEVVDFIPPIPHESLQSYAERMSVRCSDGAFLGGISFGGIVASEIARHINPLGFIQIASIAYPRELPPWFRLGRLIGGAAASRTMSLASRIAATIPARVQSSSTMRISRLGGESGVWHRWAVGAVLDWNPEEVLDCPCLRIHGTHDTTFPARYVQADVVIEGGTHNLPISNPLDTANAILGFIDGVQRKKPQDERSHPGA